MAWCRTSDKPLSELMMPYFTGAFTRHYWGRSGEISCAILSCVHDFFPSFTPLNIRNHYDKTLALFDTSWWRCYYDVYWLGGMFSLTTTANALRWRHNGHDGDSNRQPHDCLLNRLFMRRSKKTSKLRVTGLCAGNSPVTGEFPAQMASTAEIFFHLMTSSWTICLLMANQARRVPSGIVNNHRYTFCNGFINRETGQTLAHITTAVLWNTK